MPTPTLSVVHMGDSITFGQYIDPANRWTTLLADRATATFADAAIDSHNRGVSGETTRLALERYPVDLQELKPHVMTLQFGLNDCNGWETDRGLPRVSEEAFAANMTEMIRRARHFGTRHVILATNHRTLRRVVLPSGERYEDANARYSELIREIATATKVDLCDIKATFDSFGDEELEQLLLPAPDRLHLSVEGNRVYSDAIWPHYERALLHALRSTSDLARS